MDDDIWRSRCRRYAQARAVMTSRQVEMRTRSRRETAATAGRLCTPPGKWGVLSVVLTGRVIPRQAQNLYGTHGSRHGERARAFARSDRHLSEHTRTHVVATARFIVLPTHLP